MADVLILNSSPRSGGNSSFLAGIAAEELSRRNVDCLRMDVAKLRIAPCVGCDLCAEGKAKYCVTHDDMDSVYRAFLDAKAILFLSPVYWFNYSAQLKMAIDRLYGLWNWEHDFLKGKAAGAVLVYGDVDIYASGGINAISSFEHMFRFLGARVAGFAYGTANAEGDAEKNEELVASVRRLTAKLAGARGVAG